MKYLFILAYICGFCICLYQCIKDELKTKDVINLGELAMMIFISIFLSGCFIGVYLYNEKHNGSFRRRY